MDPVPEKTVNRFMRRGSASLLFPLFSPLVGKAADGEAATAKEATMATKRQAGPEPAEPQITWQALRSRLQAEKERIHQEIGSYPTPIAGCDQQFNYLLKQRAQIRREWKRLLEAEKEAQRATNPQAILDEFMRASAFLAAELVRA